MFLSVVGSSSVSSSVTEQVLLIAISKGDCLILVPQLVELRKGVFLS